MTQRHPISADHTATHCRYGWLASRGPRFQEDFLSAGWLKELEPGEELYRRGRISTHAYGLAEAIAHQPAFGTAVAGTKSKTMCFSAEKLLTFLDAEPTRYRDIIAHEYALRQGIQETVCDLVTSDGLELVARSLVWMLEFEGTDTSVPLNISQFEFAVALDVSVPTVQRAFRELKKLGVIETSYRKVAVRDPGRLKDFVRSFSA